MDSPGVNDTLVDGVIEASPLPQSFDELFLDYGKGEYKPDTETMRAFIDLGYVFDMQGNITEAGLNTLEAEGVPLRVITVLILGSPITNYSRDEATGRRVPLHIQTGSQLLVTFGGSDRRGRRYWECYAGDGLPILRVYQNSKHRFETHRWPVDLPINGNQFITET